jgi:hypothetical protein
MTSGFAPALLRKHQSFKFCVLKGVEFADLGGEVVRGRFKTTLKQWIEKPGSRLIEAFVNWDDDPEGIRRFTRQYGPLHDVAIPGADFEFEVSQFRLAQIHFRELWRDLDSFKEFDVKEGRLHFSRGAITYTAKTIYAFLHFDLLAADPEQIKLCVREACPHPYFIAGDDIRRRFCSDDCRLYRDRELKRNWAAKCRRELSEKRVADRKEALKYATDKKG